MLSKPGEIGGGGGGTESLNSRRTYIADNVLHSFAYVNQSVKQNGTCMPQIHIRSSRDAILPHGNNTIL